MNKIINKSTINILWIITILLAVKIFIIGVNNHDCNGILCIDFEGSLWYILPIFNLSIILSYYINIIINKLNDKIKIVRIILSLVNAILILIATQFFMGIIVILIFDIIKIFNT